MRVLALMLVVLAACARKPPAPPPPDRWYVGACGDAPPLGVGHAVDPPRLLVRVAPVWPDVVRQQNLQGVIIVQTVLTEEGRVCAARVVRSIDSEHAPALDEAAIAAVRQWRFTPALLEGKPRKAFYAIAVRVP